MKAPQAELVSGEAPTNLANAISDVINAALRDGMPADIASCVAIGVCADYARAEYGDAYLESLVLIVRSRAGRPLPRNQAENFQ